MDIDINAEKREEYGKNASRRIRREGKIPAVLYGAKTDAVPLTIKKEDIIQILKSDSGENTLFKVIIGKKGMPAMIKDLQTDPVRDEILHVDLIHIAMDREIKVSVPIDLIGEAIGVKSEGGFVDQMLRELEIECLPNDIPEQVEVDITDLHMQQSLKVNDITLPSGIKMISDPESVIVVIASPVKEEEKAPEAEEVEGLEAEEGAEEEKQEKTEEGSKEGE
jgi:large subunit ribosomal protein L25